MTKDTDMSFLRELCALHEAIDYKIESHDKLNPAIWTKDDKLKIELKRKLDQIVEIFIDSLNIPNLNVIDVILTGSNANYNWTQKSDIDVHLVVDYSKILSSKHQDFMAEFFKEKREHWSEKHDIVLNKFPVELSVQDVKQKPKKDEGIYSLKNGKWLVKPVYKDIQVDHNNVERLVELYAKKIDAIISNNRKNIKEIKKLRQDIRELRKRGLSMDGEFSSENLAFKILRNNNYLNKLKSYYISVVDSELSIK